MLSLTDPTAAGQPSLINEDAIWGTIRRLFDARARTVLGELIQNAARAGGGLEPESRLLTISFDEGASRVTFADRGCGLAGIAGLRTLLTLGESAYADPAVAINQHPMGLGIYSLIAHPGVSALVIESAGLGLTLDPARWWTESAYRRNWEALVSSSPVREGLVLTVTGTATFLQALLDELPTGRLPRHSRLGDLYPFQGYAGLLAILRDGTPLDLDTPPQLALPEAEVSTYFQGNLLRVGVPSEAAGGQPEVCWYEGASMGQLAVNWYGQIISRSLSVPLNAYLEVRAGRPLTPQAPVRAGLVEDDAYHAFLDVCRQTLYGHLGALNLDQPTVGRTRALFRLWPERARAESPVVLVRRLLPFVPEQGVGTEGDLARCETLVLDRAALAEQPLLAPYLLVIGADEEPTQARALIAEHGLASLLSATGHPAYLPSPSTGMASERVAWWRPGPLTDLPGSQAAFTTDPGTWGLGTDSTPPEVWQPLPKDATIVAVGEADSWDIDAAEFVAAAPDPVPFLQTCAHAAFSVDDEEPGDSERSFAASVDALIRRLLGDAVPRLDLGPIRAALGAEAGPISRITLVYDPAHPEGEHQALEVRTANGESRRFRVYG